MVAQDLYKCSESVEQHLYDALKDRKFPVDTPEKAADVFLDAIGRPSIVVQQLAWCISIYLPGTFIISIIYVPQSFLIIGDSNPTPLSHTWSMTPFLFQEDFLPAPETDYQYIFANFVTKIEEADDDGIAENSPIPMGLQNVKPMQRLLAWAKALQFSLEETKCRCEAHIQVMYDQLEGLWQWLEVDESDMDAFVEAHQESTEDTIREYEEELERMLELKREHMGAFIRADFAPFANDEHTEELLMIHEDEIRRLKEEQRQKAPLLASIKKYFDICEEEKELDTAASDQTQLLGHGCDPGRLL
ncbi:hypothetical protein C0995_007293 [Termitomyces sp. Mi166|nr:hypothetical protein C0995_007293 [Termitomyces sp. Mi166\